MLPEPSTLGYDLFVLSGIAGICWSFYAAAVALLPFLVAADAVYRSINGRSMFPPME